MWFEDAPLKLVEICEAHSNFLMAVEQAILVRDTRGRLRLALKLHDGWTSSPGEGAVRGPAGALLDIGALADALKPPLGAVFQDPVLLSGSAASNRVLDALLTRSVGWTPAWEDPVLGLRPATGRWRLLERRLGKMDWLDEDRVPASSWNHGEGPTIVTFYSFKGGVGRTTLLAATAWNLVARGHQVAVVDLDLEAPGLGTVFETPTRHGLLDALVAHAATDRIRIDPLLVKPSIFGDEAETERCWVLPSGHLDLSYLEKLARLDFLREGDEHSPVTRALQAVLGQLRGKLYNDRQAFILVDARAGLHDISGIALHGLAHIEVLVGRASEQTYAGFEIALQALSRWHRTPEAPVLFAQTMAPAEIGSSAYLTETQAFADRVYGMMSKHFYDRYVEDDAEYPPPEALLHRPLVLRYATELERPHSFSYLRERLFGDDFKRVVDRLLEMSDTTRGTAR